MRKRIQADIDLHVRENSETGICSQIYREFEDYQNKLETDFNKFKTATTEPVWNLRLEDYSVRNLNLMYGSACCTVITFLTMKISHSLLKN